MLNQKNFKKQALDGSTQLSHEPYREMFSARLGAFSWLEMRPVSLLGEPGDLMATTLIPDIAETMKVRIHDLTNLEEGQDYVLEPSPDLKESGKLYMTGQATNIDRNDYIILQSQSQTKHYQVNKIDYYAEPSDMWIACLSELS